MTASYLSEAIELIDLWLEHQKLIDPEVPGYSVAISYQGNTIYKKGLATLILKRKR